MEFSLQTIDFISPLTFCHEQTNLSLTIVHLDIVIYEFARIGFRVFVELVVKFFNKLINCFAITSVSVFAEQLVAHFMLNFGTLFFDFTIECLMNSLCSIRGVCLLRCLIFISSVLLALFFFRSCDFLFRHDTLSTLFWLDSCPFWFFPSPCELFIDFCNAVFRSACGFIVLALFLVSVPLTLKFVVIHFGELCLRLFRFRFPIVKNALNLVALLRCFSDLLCSFFRTIAVSGLATEENFFPRLLVRCLGNRVLLAVRICPHEILRFFVCFRYIWNVIPCA